MIKRLMLIGLLGLLVVLPLGGKATAACDPVMLALYRICIKIPPTPTGGSVCVASQIMQIQGLAEESLPSYETALTILAARIQWINKAGNSDPAQSYNFQESEIVPLISINGNLVIKKNGTARDYTCFENDEIIAALEAQGVDTGRKSHSKQWTAEIIVDHGEVLNTVFVCKGLNGEPLGDQNDPRATGCYFQDAYGQDILAPAGVEFGVPFTYIAQEVCSDGEGVTCPQTCPAGTILTPEPPALPTHCAPPL